MTTLLNVIIYILAAFGLFVLISVFAASIKQKFYKTALERDIQRWEKLQRKHNLNKDK